MSNCILQERLMYYIYMLVNPATGLPFYVGVGKEVRLANCRREQDHINEALKFSARNYPRRCNKHKLNTILQILAQGNQVLFEYGGRFEHEQDAFNEEIRLIAFYGRRDISTGILTNMTSGGEGVINPSPEISKKRSDTMKGRPSPLNGVILGPYSEERKDCQKEKMKIARELLTEDEKNARFENISKIRKGRVPWNAGLTMTDQQRKNMGAPKGRVPWNKGLTKDDDRVARYAESVAKSKSGQPAHNKGVPSGKKGMTYEEIYGPEKAAELKEKRRLKKIAYWESKKS